MTTNIPPTSRTAANAAPAASTTPPAVGPPLAGPPATASRREPVRRCTIEDVAAAAGVSVATVSRALRGLPNVAESTRTRVLECAKLMSYRPDPAGARLAAGRTGTLTIAVPALNGWYFSNVVAGAEAVCADSGIEFQVVGIATNADRDRLFDEARQLERRTDSLILVDITISDEQVASLDRRGIGLATVGCLVDGHPGVRIDDEHVGRIAADHLAGLGHRTFVMIGGLPSDPMNPHVARLRERGFRAGIAAHGLEVGDDSVLSGDFGITGGYDSMASLLARAEPPTAVFAFSDEMAFGALMAMAEHDVRPGIDCSIMGVDDHDFSQVVNLTTIRQPVADHGAAAARMLMASAAQPGVHPDPDPDPPRFQQPDVDLVVRSTTGAPATR